MNTASIFLLVAILTFLPPVPAAAETQSGDVTTSPAEVLTTSPIVSPPARRTDVRVSEEAQAELDLIREAYLALEALEVTGTLTTDSEVAGRVEKSEKAFSGAYLAPAYFRHEVEGELVAGSTGIRNYIYNVKQNEYLVSEAASEAPLDPDNPITTDVLTLLRNQNPSLLLALVRRPMQVLGPEVTAVELGPDQKADGKQYTALKLSTVPASGDMTVLIDKETNLVRRVTVDMKPALERSGVAGVRKATYVINYERVRRRGALGKNDFAWTPRPDARRINAPTAVDRSTTPSAESTTSPLSSSR